MTLSKWILPVILGTLGGLYYLAFEYVYSAARDEFLDQQIENARVQAELTSGLLSQKLASGYSRDQVRNEFQQSIENMSVENSFVCMFDSTGREICHPDRQRVGVLLGDHNSVLKSLSNEAITENFKEAVKEGRSQGGVREFPNRTELVYLAPVRNTGWVVASHASLEKIRNTFDHLKEKLLFIFLIIWLSTALLVYLFLQRMYSGNLKKMRAWNEDISSRYFQDLKTIQGQLNVPEGEKTSEWKRLLTDKGGKLKPVNSEDIAFIYTENKINYVVEFNGESSTSNLSLEELMEQLDPELFYRASRQVILAAKAIGRIEKHGVSQLKVTTNPVCPVEIIVSKAKLTAFKKWAGNG